MSVCGAGEIRQPKNPKGLRLEIAPASRLARAAEESVFPGTEAALFSPRSVADASPESLPILAPRRTWALRDAILAEKMFSLTLVSPFLVSSRLEHAGHLKLLWVAVRAFGGRPRPRFSLIASFMLGRWGGLMED